MSDLKISPVERANALCRFVKLLPVRTQEEADGAGIELNNLKRLRDSMKSSLEGETSHLVAQVNQSKEKYNPAIKLVESAMDSLRSKIGEFTVRENKAAEERARLAQQRIAEIEASIQAAIASVADEGDAGDAGDGARHEGTGGAEEPEGGRGQPAASAAAELRRQADEAISREMALARPAKTQGVRSVKRLDFRVDDMPSVIRYVAAHPELSSILAISVTEVRRLIKDKGGDIGIDGICVFDAATIITTGANK